MLALKIALIIVMLVWNYVRFCYYSTLQTVTFWRYVNRHLAPGAKEFVKICDIVVKAWMIFVGLWAFYQFLIFW